MASRAAPVGAAALIAAVAAFVYATRPGAGSEDMTLAPVAALAAAAALAATGGFARARLRVALVAASRAVTVSVALVASLSFGALLLPPFALLVYALVNEPARRPPRRRAEQPR